MIDVFKISGAKQVEKKRSAKNTPSKMKSDRPLNLISCESLGSSATDRIIPRTHISTQFVGLETRATGVEHHLGSGTRTAKGTMPADASTCEIS